jgi:uroporphyrinogen III methyltransferase/synthase
MGKVYLVGAGLGDVSYLTVKAQKLLAQAEVLIYDALVDRQLLQLVPPDCLKFDVGKRGGRPSTPQAEINQLLVEQCQQGKQVVRLKSGDPFIFGRTSAEIQALIEAGCAFEVVPGISSALAAPLLASIPLTDAVLSRCFAVLSAHEPRELDWEALARIDTLVILMGGRHLSEITRQLQRYGRSHSTPIAIIRWAGCPQQQIWTGTLGNILKQTEGISLSPVVIAIGEVVKLREFLQSQSPMSQPPLSGKTVLVTRSAGQSSQFRKLLEREGASVIEMPALEITPPSSWEALDNAIAHLSDFNWLILTSSNGVDYFFERLLAQGKDTRALAGVKIAVVGKKTAASLKSRNLQPDFIPPDFIADSLVEHFPESLSGLKILFPRVETGGREALVQELTAQGAEMVEVAAYQSGCPATIAPAALDALLAGAVDVITFASSKTVRHFHQLLEKALQQGDTLSHPVSITSVLEKVSIASIGPQTSETCRQLLRRVDVEAAEYTLEGLIQAIRKYFD